MTFAVVVFPGSNSDHDAHYAVEHVIGHTARYLWHKETSVGDADVVILPGGFSHGDYLRTGAIARFSPIMADVRRFAEAGGPVLGICNGFQILLECGLLPDELRSPYRSLAGDLLQRVRWCYERAGQVRLLRVHGDVHIGNILWTDDGPHIVDLDDARMAPATQDLWMLLSGERADRTAALDALLTGYTEFHEYPLRELHLVEALRTLRLLQYYAWLARRWSDPAFPRAFPWFNTQRAWQQHILDLREQAAAMEEEPLSPGN